MGTYIWTFFFYILPQVLLADFVFSLLNTIIILFTTSLNSRNTFEKVFPQTFIKSLYSYLGLCCLGVPIGITPALWRANFIPDEGRNFFAYLSMIFIIYYFINLVLAIRNYNKFKQRQ